MRRVQRRVYFDGASTTAIHPDVLQTYKSLLDKYYVNSESLYDEGSEISRMMEKARSAIAGLLGVNSEDIIFTSGSSEANSSAIKGVCFAQPGKKHIVTTNVEHSSILNACLQMEQVFGYRVTYLPVDASGKVSLQQVKDAVSDDTAIVSIMAVNNEVGSINPIDEIANYMLSETYFPYVIFLEGSNFITETLEITRPDGRKVKLEYKSGSLNRLDRLTAANYGMPFNKNLCENKFVAIDDRVIMLQAASMYTTGTGEVWEVGDMLNIMIDISETSLRSLARDIFNQITGKNDMEDEKK